MAITHAAHLFAVTLCMSGCGREYTMYINNEFFMSHCVVMTTSYVCTQHVCFDTLA